MPPVPITFVADDQALLAGPPGTARYHALPQHPGKHAGLSFQCPCGCGSLLRIRFLNDQGQPDGSCWTHDGNDRQPTCTPSILHVDGCRWHGFLTKGEFVPL